MSDLMSIFQHQAPKYDLLVSREDYQGNLLKALRSLTPLDRTRVVEFGAGTGRLTILLAPVVDSIRAFDAAKPMLQVARTRLRALHLKNWKLRVADHRKVPARPHSADIVIAGWSICCLAAYEGDHWRREVERGLAEMERVAAPGGTIIIIETLGTGYSSPTAPAALKPYYGVLEAEGFTSTWIRTDYRFQTRDEAIDLTAFFFGQDPIPAITESREGFILPECTGIWWRRAQAP